ncbi:MAG: hypothetical protein ACP5QG_01490 [candidate division WOR-3 bacterium]
MIAILLLLSESVGNMGFSAGACWPSPDSTVMLRSGTDARGGPSLDTRIFLNNTWWDTGWFAGSWGLSFGFKYFKFQGSWGKGDFYNTPGLAHLRFFNPQDRLRLGLDLAGGLCYSWIRWEPPLNDTVSTIRPLSWAGEAGAFLSVHITGYLWIESEVSLWATSGPVPAGLFEPGKEGTRDLVVTGKAARVNLLFGN